MKRQGVFLLNPTWNASPSQGYPQHKYHRYPFIHLDGERHCESSALPKNTTQCPRRGLEHGSLDPESSVLTMKPTLLQLRTGAPPLVSCRSLAGLIVFLTRSFYVLEREEITTGCVNISVLMPVLAVAVLSFLLFIHLLIRRKDNGKNVPETPQQHQKQRRRSSVAHPHAEQRQQTRRLSRDLLHNSSCDGGPTNSETKQGVVSIEMHMGGDLHSTPEPKTRQKLSRRDRKKGFYNKSFRNASVELDDVEMASHVPGDKTADEGESPKEIGFYNEHFKNDSMDSIDDYSQASVVSVFGDSRSSEGRGAYKTDQNESMETAEDVDEVFVNQALETVLEKSKSGNRQGFVNKTFHTDSMDLTDDGASTSGDAIPVEAQEVTNKPEGAILDKSKSGNRKGFFNKNFHSDSMDLTDDGASTSGETAPEDAQDATNKTESGAILDKSKSGNRKGFFNKNFHSDSMDVSDDDVLDDSACASGDKSTEEATSVTAQDNEEDTYF